MFDPTIGRWLTEDPTGFTAGDANLYRYVGNGPTNATDPSGLETFTIGWNAGFQIGNITFGGSIEYTISVSSAGAGMTVTTTGAAPANGLGLSVGTGPFVYVTNAATAQDLLGNSTVTGGSAGPINAQYVEGSNYQGVALGASAGGGAGGFSGNSTTVAIFSSFARPGGPGPGKPYDGPPLDSCGGLGDELTSGRPSGTYEAPEPTYDDYNGVPITPDRPKPPAPPDPWEGIEP